MTPIIPALMSSNTDKWNTPIWVIDKLTPLFPWDLDVCASEPNVCENYFTEDQDGLLQEWEGLCWMNPPYGREIGKWVKKAAKSSVGGKATVVCLLPARTDPRWFHDNIRRASLVVFVANRFYFSEGGRAPFPSMFVVFGNLSGSQRYLLAGFGWPIFVP